MEIKGMVLQRIEGEDFIDLDYFGKILAKALLIIYFKKFRKSHYKKRRIKNYRRLCKWL